MVVARGAQWGSSGVPDSGVPVVFADQDASLLIESGCREMVIAGGDMARTVGALPPSAGCSYRRLPIDLVEIGLVDRHGQLSKHYVISHGVVRNPWMRGGLIRGPVTVICNSQYVRSRDVAPRGHPNDGRVEVLEFQTQLTCRERLQILARTKRGEHLPHPAIRSSSVSTFSLMNTSGVIVLDGRRIGRRRLEYVEPRPDALVIWAPIPHVPADVGE